MKTVIYVLAVFGAFASLKVSIRESFFARKPFSCAVCMGYWIGFIFSVFYFGGHWWGFSHQMNAFAAAGGCWILNRVVTGEY